MKDFRKMQTDSVSIAIRNVLIDWWDPIGVMDDPEWPRDEYDSYVEELRGFISRGESVDFIARHLCFVEEKYMGLGAPPTASRISVAEKLLAISV
jgi:hypothetical protein